jgi:amino acid adenylation domain-containing protein
MELGWATPATGAQDDVRHRCLDAFFSASARRYPSRPALYVGGQTWSYRELDAECARIEGALRRVLPPQEHSKVGLIYGRSEFSYAAAIAIMRSGHVYVPLNPKIPADRRLKMIEDAAITTLIVDATRELSEDVLETLRRSRPLTIILSARSDPTLESQIKTAGQHTLLQAAETGCAVESGSTLLSPSSSEAPRLAYIIYTSGSTGVPKGVVITQESAWCCIEKAHRLFQTHEEDRFTQFSALSFDVSILDLFLCWKSGAALYVPEASEALVPLSFAATHDITVWSSVPSLANILRKLRLLKNECLPQIRLSLFCGEALSCDLARDWAAAVPNSRLLNLYGPTECTIFATYAEYERQNVTCRGTVPIGGPLPGVGCLIVNEGSVIEEEDVTGELWLSGDQLAVGYWKNPAATQAAFVHFSPPEARASRWYRTGDLVSRRGPSGLYYRGRLDRQVKLLGHRIELQEVESALQAVIGCALVAVIPVYNAGGMCEKLIAYCDRLTTDEAAIKTQCLHRIPRYMVPERILELETFPFSDHGKVDYKALAGRARVAVG